MATSVTHRVAEERSLALHAAVARRLREEPGLADAARRRVLGWLEDGAVPRRWAERWLEILSGPVEAVAAAMTDDSEAAATLRQVSPFAGALEPRARWAVLRRHRGGQGTA